MTTKTPDYLDSNTLAKALIEAGVDLTGCQGLLIHVGAPDTLVHVYKLEIGTAEFLNVDWSVLNSALTITARRDGEEVILE